MSLPLPILQIEPTDRCNLKCAMCSPQVGGGLPHGDGVPRGDLDFDLYRRILADIADAGPDFDHLILQWMGEPTLHAQWLDMLEHAVSIAGHRFGYFRVDTNALRLNEPAAERLCALVSDNPGRTVLFVFSLDAASAETYHAVKGVDAFERVTTNIERFLQLRQERVDASRSPLNAQFQLVLQQGNAHEVAAFVQRWDDFLAELRTADTYDEIMIKRVAVGTGGPEQEAADRLYDETLGSLGLKPGRLRATELKLWLDRPWEGE